MKLQTIMDSSENWRLTRSLKRRISALAARWRSGYAEDCKASAAPRKSSIVCSFLGLFDPRNSAEFKGGCKLDLDPIIWEVPASGLFTSEGKRLSDETTRRIARGVIKLLESRAI